MVQYVTMNLQSADTPRFRRDKKLEARLKEIGLTFTTSLNWGADSNHVYVEASNKRVAMRKITENKSLLERAYDVVIDMRNLYLGQPAPE